ncbi:MAG: arylsulfatase [Acidobacteriaceae bacterium]|nr:arylsulfatase [Acidobacteriaceae bacterium]
MRIAGVWVAGLAIADSVSSAQTVIGSSPDVYLITIDTLRADHVHCYGDDQIQTPALDSIARDGVRFTQAFTPSPITNTAHTSILTGLLPSVHGVTDFGIPLAKTIPTWPELLKQNGYQTAAFIGAVVLDSRTLAPGLDRGFDYYDNFPSDSSESKHWGRVERRGEDVVHRAEAWMDGHPAKPRFVWVHLYDPHDPYDPPPPFAQIYKDRLYDGEIAYADSALGHLLTYLKRQNRYNRALIVVVGDHGEGLGEHGEQTHGIFLYDATTHVPLLIKLPASGKPAVVEAQVQTTDVLPTVLDLLDIAAPAALAKRSLRGEFAEGKENDRLVFGETDYPLRFGWAPLRAVRSGGFKFIEAPRPELYDLGKDPGELKNEYEPWNPTVQHLRAELTSSAMRPPRASASSGTASSKTLNELRALGYLGPADAQSSTNVPELSSLPDPKDKIEEQNLLHSAMMSADQGHAQNARLLLKKVLQLNPDSSAALRQLGELEFKAGEYRSAADHFHSVRKAHPDDAPAALYEGKALDKLGDAHGARSALEAALTSPGGQLEARVLLANVDLKLGDRAAAEDQFEAVLLLDPSNHDALLGLAQEQSKEKRFTDVVDLLGPRAKGASADLLQLLMQAYENLGRTADAEKVHSQLRASQRRR